MRPFNIIIATLALFLLPVGVNAQSSRQQFTVPTASGGVLVESFGNCTNATCPAVMILSGSKGFGSPVYDEIGQTIRAAGLNAYPTSTLSPRRAEHGLASPIMRSGCRTGFPPFKAWPPISRGNRATAGRSAFSEFPLARKSLRLLQSGESISTLWCWSMAVCRTAIRSLSAHCRPCF